ncbi:flagellar biosynthesis protein FliR [Burkholderia territorii]|uniref:flagellar protein FlgN n=1 Tax=Burkholderia territorii TaxID=1503055 RepID=UPI00075E82ED|nr:flagellar protein FlgN [Burkholderia territorii]KWH08477.1 flagellar biosynthesis protein FliR [Burkholderia territorii]
MTRKEAFALMFEGIGHDRARYVELKGLLDQQFRAALRRDGAALTVTGNAILALADTLNASHDERKRCARVLSGAVRPGTMSDVCASLSGLAGDAMRGEWRKLEAQVVECHRLNRRNASLITSQFEIMQRVLHGESNTYVRT